MQGRYDLGEVANRLSPFFAFRPHSFANCLLCCQLAPTLLLNIAYLQANTVYLVTTDRTCSLTWSKSQFHSLSLNKVTNGISFMDVVLFILIFELLKGIQGLLGHVDWLFACCLKMFK